MNSSKLSLYETNDLLLLSTLYLVLVLLASYERAGGWMPVGPTSLPDLALAQAMASAM